MPRSHDIDRLIAELASRQSGVVARKQLRTAGLSDSAISVRMRRGYLNRLHPGVYVVGGAALTHATRTTAALLASAPGSALSRLSAAAEHRISRFAASTIQLVSTRQQRTPLPAVDARRTRWLPASHVVLTDAARQWRATSVSRTIADLGTELTPWQIAHVLNEARYRRSLRIHAIERILDARARPGAPVVRRALALYHAGSAGTRSLAEDELLAAMLDAGLPEPLVNMHVQLDAAVFEADFHWPEQRCIVEVDGSGHGTPNRARDDKRRDAATRSAGWRVLRVRPSAVMNDPYAVAAQVAALIVRRG